MIISKIERYLFLDSLSVGVEDGPMQISFTNGSKIVFRAEEFHNHAYFTFGPWKPCGPSYRYEDLTERWADLIGQEVTEVHPDTSGIYVLTAKFVITVSYLEEADELVVSYARKRSILEDDVD